MLCMALSLSAGSMNSCFASRQNVGGFYHRYFVWFFHHSILSFLYFTADV